MKHIFSAIFLGFFAINNSNAEPASDFSIICEKTSDPDFSKYTLYKNPPKTIDEMASDAVHGGILGMLVEKPKTVSYIIKPSVNRIENFDGTTNFGGGYIKINDASIEAVTSSQVLRINRLTGAMTHTIVQSDETIAAWKKKHGGTPPKQGSWGYQCKKLTANVL